jgi:hypothetical protein
METLLEIEEAIGRLPKDQMMALVERLEQRMADEWDRKFERDVASGRLNEVAQRALADHRAGLSTHFPAHEE